jgi:hypothetical protein
MIRQKNTIKKLLPKLTERAREMLEQSLVNKGCLEPLLVWGDILIDGNNRYEICSKHGIPYETKEIEFDSMDEAKQWIIRHQLGRRNLTKDQYKHFLGELYKSEKKDAHRPPGPTQKGNKNCPLKTADKIAKEYGVHPNTVKNAEKFADEVNADPELAQAVREGTPVRKIKAERKKLEDAIAKSAAENTRPDDVKMEMSKELARRVGSVYSYMKEMINTLGDDFDLREVFDMLGIAEISIVPSKRLVDISDENKTMLSMLKSKEEPNE